MQRLWAPVRPVAAGSKGVDQPIPETRSSRFTLENTLRHSPSQDAARAVIDSPSLSAQDLPTNQADVPQHGLMGVSAKGGHQEELFSSTTDRHGFEGIPTKFSDSNTEVTFDAEAIFETLQLESTGSFSKLQAAGAHEVFAGLWVPSVAVQVQGAEEGLFCIDHFRSDYKTTSNKAAAQGTRPTLRATKKPLSQVTSTSLWSSPTRHTFAHDWISLSSIRPSTPGGVSSASGSESPFSDASSAFSSVTGLSTVGSTFICCPEDNVAQQNPRPDWDASLQKVASPKRLARGLVSAADWDTALDDAIRASGYGAVRLSTSPSEAAPDADCDVALEKDINASEADSTTPEAHRASIVAEPPPVVVFDVSRNHPVFAVSGLDTDSADVHPAGKGYFFQW